MPTYRYIYFNLRARGEIPRLILHAAGIPFEDKRIELNQWPGSLKATIPFGQLPVFEIDGVMYPESMAISRYLAAEHGLAGISPVERLRADYISEQCRSAKEGMYKYVFENDETAKANFKKTFENETRGKFLGYWEKELANNTGGNGYIVGNQMVISIHAAGGIAHVPLAMLHSTILTIADLCVMDVLDSVLEDDAFKSTFQSTFPKLAQSYATVSALPTIKKYKGSRPQSFC